MQVVNSVRSISQEANISKNQAHRIMCDIIGFQSDMMHCTQQLYEEDT